MLYLGHTVQSIKLIADEKNRKAVRDSLFPASQMELRFVFEICNAYRRLVRNFGRAAVLLSVQARKSKLFALDMNVAELNGI